MSRVQHQEGYAVTRMWLLPVGEVCDKHLYGEHGELHQLVGMIEAEMWPQIGGQIAAGNVDLTEIVDRHSELEEYLDLDSPLLSVGIAGPLDNLDSIMPKGGIDLERSRRDLKERCPDCRELIKEAQG